LKILWKNWWYAENPSSLGFTAFPKFVENQMLPEEFARRAGLTFDDPHLLRRALTHRSYVNENPEALEDNERLEFLGDAALGFLTASWIYNHFPEMDEGQLTRLRSALVRTEQLAAFAREIQLGEAIMLGRGEEATGGRERPALLCASFEALVGAIYLDSGFDGVIDFMTDRVKRAAQIVTDDTSLFDARSLLQIWAQAEIGETPRYETVESTGPDHAREFVVEVNVGNGVRGRGRGRSKQDAAQAAATDAMDQIGHSSFLI
jgi:ribonuclease-3